MVGYISKVSSLSQVKTKAKFVSVSDLKQSCRQVADDEGGCHGSMASLQEVDGVQEEEVTWDYQDDQDSG